MKKKIAHKWILCVEMRMAGVYTFTWRKYIFLYHKSVYFS